MLCYVDSLGICRPVWVAVSKLGGGVSATGPEKVTVEVVLKAEQHKNVDRDAIALVWR